ncbi:hypothetical protein C461_13576 [Halorubrum aidingense JCM 13560]|uniref:Uncharacterized protein n=1 Tax=Halorubrum aidingense JCM 13560 TaxID=1230454 RepID=M0P851_9EURY|nr:hypothetical protein C461_13576 [Halorubrum aidingense JCM 13560]
MSARTRGRNKTISSRPRRAAGNGARIDHAPPHQRIGVAPADRRRVRAASFAAPIGRSLETADIGR